ncbi:Protein trichome birefringence-like 37 [Senna tora]|uniref:Protein trichome birefringence-like 37 n=1 Tax=Senna tora TaxID=362788 RepID=A0A834T668_9FABA|nr:Protein trichome birefringence-like 37 [Senna tora]
MGRGRSKFMQWASEASERIQLPRWAPPSREGSGEGSGRNVQTSDVAECDHSVSAEKRWASFCVWACSNKESQQFASGSPSSFSRATRLLLVVLRLPAAEGTLFASDRAEAVATIIVIIIAMRKKKLWVEAMGEVENNERNIIRVDYIFLCVDGFVKLAD